ncbi:hypothetical protein ACOT5C_10580 [Clostridium perfringens]|uniref:hypothetical protein n=1 Tax=Clostridium perfringens TaxID=1502 RepID=UPI003BAD7566
MATNKGFTKIDNSIITSEILSNNSKLIYMQIKYYSTIPNFKLCKITLKKVCNLGEKLFLKAIKELKTLGIIEQRNDRKGKQNFFYYALVEQNEVKKEQQKEEAPKKEAKKEVAPKDSDNNTPLEGQMHISEFVEGEILEVEKEATKEGLNADLGIIREAIEVANNYDKKINNRTKFILGTIRNLLTNTKTNKANQNFKKQKSLNCHNFSEREYDWESLECELLGYGLNDRVNELDSVPQLPSFIGSSL